MATIDLNKRKGVKAFKFPDGQPHVELDGVFCCEPVDVTVSIDGADRLLELAMLSNALDSKFCDKGTLRINYLLGARYDRHMLKDGGDSYDLKVIADIINSLKFKRVEILDPHSPVSLNEIKNSVEITNQFLVEKYHIPETLIICPDKGATLKVDRYKKWNPNLTEMIYCKKHRDLSNGKITLVVEEPELCKGRNCIIIDDICDGGATFLAIADQIECNRLTLMVTHGIFSKGIAALLSKFDKIITTDSICKIEDKEWEMAHPQISKVTIHKLEEYEPEKVVQKTT